MIKHYIISALLFLSSHPCPFIFTDQRKQRPSYFPLSLFHHCAYSWFCHTYSFWRHYFSHVFVHPAATERSQCNHFTSLLSLNAHIQTGLWIDVTLFHVAISIWLSFVPSRLYRGHSRQRPFSPSQPHHTGHSARLGSSFFFPSRSCFSPFYPAQGKVRSKRAILHPSLQAWNPFIWRRSSRSKLSFSCFLSFAFPIPQ